VCLYVCEGCVICGPVYVWVFNVLVCVYVVFVSCVCVVYVWVFNVCVCVCVYVWECVCMGFVICVYVGSVMYWCVNLWVL